MQDIHITSHTTSHHILSQQTQQTTPHHTTTQHIAAQNHCLKLQLLLLPWPTVPVREVSRVGRRRKASFLRCAQSLSGLGILNKIWEQFLPCPWKVGLFLCIATDGQQAREACAAHHVYEVARCAPPYSEFWLSIIAGAAWGRQGCQSATKDMLEIVQRPI